MAATQPANLAKKPPRIPGPEQRRRNKEKYKLRVDKNISKWLGNQRDSSGVEELEDWHDVVDRNSRPPLALTVTHINHSHDLQRLRADSITSSDNQTSAEWLGLHGIKALGLTVDDLISKGEITKVEDEYYNGEKHQLQFDPRYVNSFERRLNEAIGDINNRINWLMHSSRKRFGLVKGKNICLIVDSSNANLQVGRRNDFIRGLQSLLNEQLSVKHSIMLIGAGSTLNIFYDGLKEITHYTMEESKEWIKSLEGNGGNNLLAALQIALGFQDIDNICCIMGSSPDQSHEILCGFVQEKLIGRQLPIQTISYECTNHLTNLALRNIAEVSGGRFHIYNSADIRQIHSGSDMVALLSEIEAAKDVERKINEMRQGMVGEALASAMVEISEEVRKLPSSRFLPRPPNHTGPLKINEASFEAKSTAEWFKEHGLRANGLNLYQVLAPNAFSYKEGFIPVIDKRVKSVNNERAMVQFKWHDASIKNVHVDAAMLFEYQRRLCDIVSVYEQRIEWLSLGSRRLWGNVMGQRVCLLIDTCEQNMKYIIHIQHSIRLLLEHQFSNKNYFNIIAFGDKANAWKPQPVVVTPQSLQLAWSWTLGLECSGGRNFLEAFKMAASDCYDEVYLFSSGLPDHIPDVCVSFVREVCAGTDTKLHTILYSIDDSYEDNGRYGNQATMREQFKQLAQAGNGRFHWFKDTGVVESDDVEIILNEIRKAATFCKKAASLIESLQRKSSNVKKFTKPADKYPMVAEFRQPIPMPPRQTILSSMRQMISQENLEKDKTKNMISLGLLPQSYTKTRKRILKKNEVKVKMFYTSEEGKMNSKGGVLQVTKKTKQIQNVDISSRFSKSGVIASITTRKWLKQYGLSKLGLNLNKKALDQPECRHEKISIISKRKIQKDNNYCSVLPSIPAKGTVKHIPMTFNEISSFIADIQHVIKQYVKRLQWLLNGSRRVFGTVVERKVVIIIDSSGSMEPYIENLKKDLCSLIWDQLNKNQIYFNILRFSDTIDSFADGLQEPTKENCYNATQWVNKCIVANGGTCTLEALKEAHSDNDTDGIYLLTDGKPNSSCSLVLSEIQKLYATSTSSVPIHTISFNCNDEIANTFLMQLSAQTHGRYLRYSDVDMMTIQQFSHALQKPTLNEMEELTYPDIQGDDISRLISEIRSAQEFWSVAYNCLSCISPVKDAIPDDPENEAPVFANPLKDISVRLGTKVCFSVKVSGTPRPSVVWRHEGYEIVPGLEHKKLFKKGDTYLLIISGANPEDEGKYSVTAENASGITISEAVLLVQEQNYTPEL